MSDIGTTTKCMAKGLVDSRMEMSLLARTRKESEVAMDDVTLPMVTCMWESGRPMSCQDLDGTITIMDRALKDFSKTEYDMAKVNIS